MSLDQITTTDGISLTEVSASKVKQLLEAGVHFGHQTRRWNPKMSRYIFTERGLGYRFVDYKKAVERDRPPAAG